MTDFLLVHGAWHGGWCWQRVSANLVSRGHRVFAPTLVGLADGDDTKGVTLQTHIEQISGLIANEQLRSVVLVGHSYAGFVISGVAERTGAVGAIIFLDAFMPSSGQCMLDLGTQRGRDATTAAVARGETALPSFSAEFFMVNKADRAWVDSMCRPHPIGSFTQPVTLTGARDRIARKAYIRSSLYANESLDVARRSAAGSPGWLLFDVQSGHDVMLDAPERLVEILLDIAGR